jgi:hypothetical protein
MVQSLKVADAPATEAQSPGTWFLLHSDRGDRLGVRAGRRGLSLGNKSGPAIGASIASWLIGCG